MAAVCSWRADPDGGVGAGPIGGGLAVRGEAVEVVAVVVMAPFMAAGWRTLEEETWKGRDGLCVEEARFGVFLVGSATRMWSERAGATSTG